MKHRVQRTDPQLYLAHTHVFVPGVHGMRGRPDRLLKLGGESNKTTPTTASVPKPSDKFKYEFAIKN